jgi:class 3 adenylate cyclase
VTSPDSIPAATETSSVAGENKPTAATADALASHELANLRHSLRTPLNQILGYSEMLQEEAADQDYEHCLLELQKVHAAGQQLLALVNTSLAPARMAAGHFDAAEFHRDCRTLLNLIIGYSGLCEEYAQERAQQSLGDDVRRIQTAAANLLGLLNDPKVLEPLTRARAVHSPTPVGRPVGKVVPASPGEVSGAEVPNLTGTVLLVDDDEMNRDMLSRRLERQGHEVILAENGRQALAILKTNCVDLILLDILMPELDGLQTLEQLKADETLRHTPVIMLSALDEIDRVVRCIEVGADDYLAKPFNPVLLKARINACLEKKRLRDQEQAYLEQLQSEREKSERLLLNILPASVADRLKDGETVIADTFPNVTVLFADLVDFTRLASRISAGELVRLLNDIFSQFDWLVELHRLEKIKTIGDAYMVVGGLPNPRHDHAAAAAEMALDMQKVVARLGTLGGIKLDLRIGISSGPVVAGIIGSKKFIYDLWGDTVNIASRMESQGELGSIQVSETTFKLLQGAYNFRERGQLEVKGRGVMTTYFLLGRKSTGATEHYTLPRPKLQNP